MRILMIAGVAGKAEAGGAGVVYNLSRELRRFGHSVKPLFFEDLLPNPRWPKRFRVIEFAGKVAEYVVKVKSQYDVVNIHAPYGFWYGWRRRRQGSNAGPPYVMTMHGLEERRNYAMRREAKKGRAEYFRWQNRFWQNIYHMRIYRNCFETADQCIVLNREAQLFLQLRYNLPPDRVWFVPNGVGEEFFRPRYYADGLATKLLFVGTWIDHKGIYYLVEAFEHLLKLMPGIRLTIAGCGTSEENVRRYFSSSTQSALAIRPTVQRSEMPALYADADIFLFPSLVEGMPLVLLEAMASGLPVITTMSSGMTDLVENGYDGLLIIPGDTSSLFAATRKLCEDSPLRRRLGTAAQTKMRRFSWSHCAKGHEAVFRRALGMGPDVPASSTVPGHSHAGGNSIEKAASN